MKKLLPLFLAFVFVFSACSLLPSRDKPADDQPVVNMDKVIPTITCQEPASDAVDVPVDSNIKLCFSEEMKLDATHYGKAFQLLDTDGVLIEAVGTYSNADKTYVIDPIVDLKAKTQYTFRVRTNNTQDLAGNSLNAPLKLEFTTK